MADILDPKTGDLWQVVDGVWKKIREGRPVMRLNPLSRVNGDTPATCSNPECNTRFEGSAFRGKSGKLYCTRHCRDEMSDSATLEDAGRSVH